MLFILVRADHIVNMEHPIGSFLQTLCPELGTVEDQLIAVLIHEVLVVSADIVLPRAKGYVSGNMDFNKTAPYFDKLYHQIIAGLIEISKFDFKKMADHRIECGKNHIS